MNKKLLVLAAIFFGAALFIGSFYYTQINQPVRMMENMPGQTASAMMGGSGMMGMMSQEGSGMMNMMHSQHGAGMMGNGQHGSMIGMMNDANCELMENHEHQPGPINDPTN
jgi:hypothetical protein